MAVPGSGPLKLWDNIWNQEIGGTKGNNSLHSGSIYAGFSTPDAMSDFYGWSDIEIPSVSTSNFSSVVETSMTANGNVSDTGNENPTRGFYFGTNAAAAGNNTKYSVGVGGAGAFSRSMTDLTHTTTYYGWAFACNSAGEAQGSMITQTTASPPFTPSLTSAGTLCSISCACSDGGDNYLQVYSGWINPYNGGLNSICFSGGGANSSAQRSVDNRYMATDAKNFSRALAAVWGGTGKVQFWSRSNSCYSNVTGLTTAPTGNSGSSSNYIRNTNYRAGYFRINTDFCFSDIRLKTNINYL